jgi:hypothetical protein
MNVTASDSHEDLKYMTKDENIELVSFIKGKPSKKQVTFADDD